MSVFISLAWFYTCTVFFGFFLIFAQFLGMTVKDRHPAFLGSKMPIFKCVILIRQKNMYVTKEKVGKISFNVAVMYQRSD